MAINKAQRRPLPVPEARAAVAGGLGNSVSRQPDAARFAARDRAEVTLDSIGDAVLSTDLAGRVTYLNAAAEAMTGWSRTAAAGRPIGDVLHIVERGTREPARDPLNLAIELDKTVGLMADSILVRPDGQETEIEDSAAPIRGRDGTVVGAVMVFRDVGAALETSRQMSSLALRDALTGLPNRLLLGDRLTAAIALAHRHDTPLAVLFMDVDDFKSLNDSLGHVAGDQLLQSMASRLQDSVRHSDTVSRYGGDEFVIILSEMNAPGNAAAVGRKLLQAVAQPHRVGSRDASVTASLGISLYPDHSLDPGMLIALADEAMYDAKRAGPGNFRLATGR
jgi:diguanylate cyclase (GGDEF)-like protein/PAS domain S-box-containing protein